MVRCVEFLSAWSRSTTGFRRTIS